MNYCSQKKKFLAEEKELLKQLDEKEDKLKRTTISNKEIDMIIADTYIAIEKRYFHSNIFYFSLIDNHNTRIQSH